MNGQQLLPKELQLKPRTPLPMWLREGRPIRELRPRTPAVTGPESFDDARERGRMARVEQGFAEQVALPWP